ncbi:MAG: DUF5320 domain-containing protein [Dehalococcoidia bacterium]|nr:DUF5320 domain-containing protein [Dehalococcoidia bacterium]
MGAPPPWPYQAYYDREPLAREHAPYSPGMTREEELGYLRDQAEAVQEELEQIELRMRDLETNKEE